MIDSNHIVSAITNMDVLTASILLTLSLCSMVYFGTIVLDAVSYLGRRASLRIWERRIQRRPKRHAYWARKGF